MPRSETATLLRNLDQRVLAIEQKLPALPTKDDLTNALERYATKDDLATALERYATKDDLKTELERYATKDDLKTELERYATKDDLKTELERFATREELRLEGQDLRRYMKMLLEELYDKLKLVLDGLGSHTDSLTEHRARLDAHDHTLGRLDLRVTALEHGGPRR
jgi:hypothetical protein